MIDWPDAAQRGSLYAAGLNAVLLGVLLTTHRWWKLGDGTTRQAPGPAPDHIPPAPAASLVPQSSKIFWCLLGVILVVAAVVRLPLARSSLWWDEVWQARNASVGEWRPDRKNPGEWRFRETTWAQSLWNYRKPANHPPMALASKACHEVWRKLSGAPTGAFNEFVLRLPGFAASLAGIGLVALLLRAWSMPVGGLMAAWFMTLHPWHVRYGIDCRGYTFLVPLTLIGLWSLWRACGPSDASSRRHRHALCAWWIFGITQAFILWSHLLSVWVCLGLCLTGIWWISRTWSGADRWRRLARLAAVQLLGAMVFLQLFLPNLLQASQWGEKNQDGRLLNAPVFWESLTEVGSGAGVAVTSLVTGFIVLGGLGLGILRRPPGTAGLIALFLSAGGFLLAVWAADFYFYPRFLFAIMAPLAAAFGLGLEMVQRFTRDLAPWRLPVWYDKRWIFGLLIPGLMLAQGLSPMWQRGFSPLREAAGVLRDAQGQGGHVFGYGFGAEALQYYFPSLPYARESDAPEVLADAVAAARAAGQPLFVATGYEDLNRLALPRGFDLLDDPSQFTEVWKQAGLEPQFAYRIRRMDPP